MRSAWLCRSRPFDHRSGGDDIADWNNRVVQVETDGVTTQVTPSSRTPEIRLSTAALAALYSGKRTAYTLANWGLLRGDARTIAMASQLFLVVTDSVDRPKWG